MNKDITEIDPYFNLLGDNSDEFELPSTFTFLVDFIPHPICLVAVEKLQNYLQVQVDWKHNFGLSDTNEGAIIGKMFGVMVVVNKENQLGYLAAFSGKMAGSNSLVGFVPPIFDGLEEPGFVNSGMNKLTRINDEIEDMESQMPVNYLAKIAALKTERKVHSYNLQNEIFDQYQFLNKAGEPKSLMAIFSDFNSTRPPSGAGECAAPKLLQYAFQHQMRPVAIAEFWWGQSPKSAYWKHGQFYPCCKEKCGPILVHMLEGIDD